MANQAAQLAAQNEEITQLQSQIETQAAQLETMQNQVNDMVEAMMSLQTKAAKCGGCPPGNSPGGSATGGIKLNQNIPNPFDHYTRIDFSLPGDAMVILEITDATGRPLVRLIDSRLPKGSHSVSWNGAGYAPGVYFYTLYANGQLLTKKMIKN